VFGQSHGSLSKKFFRGIQKPSRLTIAQLAHGQNRTGNLATIVDMDAAMVDVRA
jgi:hypothetical protein